MAKSKQPSKRRGDNGATTGNRPTTGKAQTDAASEGHPPRRPLWVRVLVLLVLAALIVAVTWTYRKPPRQKTAIAVAADKAEPEVAQLLRSVDDVACSLVEQYPESPEAMEVLGRAHYRLGEFTAAEMYWEKCLELNADFCPAIHSIALLNLETGNNAKAVEYFGRALQLQPDSSSFAVELSQALMADGQTEKACEILEKDVQRHPKSVATLSMLGQAYVQARNYPQAKTYLQRTIAIDPNFSSAYNGLVTACANLGEEDLAKEYAEQLKALKANEESMHRTMLKEHDEIKKMEGVLGEIYTASANVHLVQNDPGQAEEYLKKAIALAPGYVAAHEILTWLYEQQGRKNEAVDTLKQLLEIAPDNVSAQFSSAELCTELGMFDEAEAAYLRIIELAPKQAEPRAQLAWLYVNQVAKLPEARKLAEQALECEPLAKYYYLLGVTCQINDDKEGARRAVAQAAALDPQNPEYRKVLKMIGAPTEKGPTEGTPTKENGS